MEKAPDLSKLKGNISAMKFGQVMSGGYDVYDMASMPDAASAVRRACGTAAGMPDMAKNLRKHLCEDGNLEGDHADAKASAMAVFVMAQRLAIESYTAVRLIKQG